MQRFLGVLPVDELIFYAPGKAIKDIFNTCMPTQKVAIINAYAVDLPLDE